MAGKAEKHDLEAKAQEPVIIERDGRQIVTNGWSIAALIAHLKWHEKAGEWCEMTCLARTFRGRNSPSARESVRLKLNRAFQPVARAGYLLLREYAKGLGTHGETIACGLYPNDPDALDRQFAEDQLAKLRRREHFTKEMLDIIAALMTPARDDHD